MTRADGSAEVDAGQSSIELLGLLPLIALVVLCLAQLLATGAAHTAASSAAEAAAAALLQHTGDPAAAARAAAPAWSRDRLSVVVDDRHVRVCVRPRAFVPGTAKLLAVTAEADAGPVSAASAALEASDTSSSPSAARVDSARRARSVRRASLRAVDRAGRRSALAA